MWYWDELPPSWQAAFHQAWEAWKMGSVPIGAALADEHGRVIVQGRSMQFEKHGAPGQVVWSKLSHAEVNTLLQVSAHDHPNIRGCTLYSTMEPCPLCVGALVMSNVRNLCFAARDAWAGSVNLIEANKYIISKNIHVSGPFNQLEVLSVAMNTEHFLRNSGLHNSAVIESWEKDCPEGVLLGRQWFDNGTLEQYKAQDKAIGEIINKALSLSYEGDA